MSNLAQELERMRIELQSARERIALLEHSVEQLTAREALCREVSNAQQDYICRYLPDLTIEFVNQAYSKRFGLRPDEMIGRRFSEDFLPAELTTLHERIRTLNPTSPDATSTQQVLQPDGSKLWVEWRDTVVLDQSGQIICYQTIGRDVSIQVQMEQKVLRHKAILEQSQDTIGLTDLNGKILYINPAGAALCGHQSPQEMIGKIALDYYTPAERERFNKQIRPALKQGQWDGITRITRIDGSEVEIQQSTFLIYEDDKPAYFASIMRDLTEQRRAQQEIQRHEERFAKIFEMMPIGVAIARQDDRRYIEVNEHIEALTGYSREEIIGRNATELGLIPRRMLDQDGVDQVNRIGKHLQEFDIRDRSGKAHHVSLSIVPIDLDGVPCFMFAVQDLTEQQQAEEELRRSQERFSKVFENLPLATTIMHRNTRQFLDVNERFLTLTGFSRAEVINHTTVELGIFKQLLPLDKILDETGKVLNLEIQGRTKTGETLFALISIVEIELDGIPCYINTVQDITEYRELQEREKQRSQYSRAVLAASDELITLQDDLVFDRRAVELMREMLGVERCAFFLIDAENHVLQGTFGTGETGETVDERKVQLPLGQWQETIAQTTEPWILKYDIPQTYWDGEVIQEFGIGWYAATVVRVGGEPIGILTHDAAISGAPFDLVKQEAIVLYASLLGNIIQRRRAEKARQMSEERYRILVESSNAVIAVIGTDGVFQYINEKGAEYYQISRDQFIDKRVEDFYDTNGVEKFYQLVATIRQTGERISYESPSGLQSEYLYHTSISPVYGEGGTLTAVMMYSLDVTPMRQAEIALRESEERYRVLVEGSNAIIAKFALDGKILFVNGTGAEYYRKPASELIGSNINALYPNNPDGFASLVETIIRTDAPVFHEMPSDLYPDRVYNTAMYPLRDQTGKINSIMGYSVDVTVVRQAQLALRESEERYRKIVETASEGIWLVNTDADTIYLNDRMAQMLGYTPEEVIGRSIYQFMEEDQIPIMQEHIDRRRQKIDEQYDFQYRRKDGSTLWVSISASPFVDLDGKVTSFLAMMTDITPRKLQEIALQQSEARQRALIRSIPDLIFRTTADAVFVDYHAPDNALLALPPEAFIGKRTSEVLPPDVSKLHLETTRTVLETGQVSMFEYSLEIAGESRYFESRIAPVSQDEVLAIVRDITESKQAADALQAANDRLEDRVRERTIQLEQVTMQIEAIVNNSGDGIVLLTSDYRIQQANHAFRKMFNLPVIEEYGFQLLELATGETITALKWVLQDVMNNHAVERIELPLQSRSGAMVDVEISISPVEQTNTLDQGYVCIFRDISDRKRNQNQIAEERNLLRTLIDSMPDYIYAKDLEHRFVLCNQTLAESFGMNHPELMLGQSDLDFFPADVATEMIRTEDEIYRTGESLINYEHPVQSNRGGFEWGLTTKVPLRTLNGDLIGLVGITRDITERKQTEAVLEQKYEDERQFQYYLRVLHQVMLELTTVETMDQFYLRVVELARNELDFDRCAFFLYDEKRHFALGTYGTSPTGEIVNEQGNDFQISTEGVMWKALNNPAHFHVEEESRLYDSEHSVIGTGWNASVALYRGDRNLGWLVADNLIHKQPISAMRLEVLAQFGVLVASVLARKQVEEELRRNEETYRTVVTSMTEGIVLQTNTGVIEACNAAAERILGLSAEQMMGRTSIDPRWESIHEDGSPFPGETHPAMVTLRTGDPIYEKIMGVHKPDGSLTWISINSQPIHRDEDHLPDAVVATFTDITSRKVAEDALRESESKYRQLIETMGGGITMSDLNGNLIYANDRFCEALGLTREELMSQGLMAFIDPVDYPLALDQKMRREQGETSSYELHFILKDGRRTTHLVSGSPMYDLNGKRSGSFAVSIDITAQKEAEDALRRSLEREKELGQLKTQFVSTTSHEFRTPLATILATTETLMHFRDRLNEEQITARLDKIRKQVNHLRQIMDDVLQLARFQARRMDFRPAHGDLQDLCEEIVEEFNSGTENHDRVRYHASGEPVEMVFDPRLMRQVISNLMSNALKYSPREKQVDLTMKVTGELVTLTIQDYGMGIPSESLPHMFEPFHRASNVGTIPGTGLGLPIVKESVELHGGTIMLASELGQGATFTVKLPTTLQIPAKSAHEEDDFLDT